MTTRGRATAMATAELKQRPKRAKTTDTDRPLNKRDLQKVRTRKLILQAGREIFASRGFDTPSVDDVARAAGISRAAFYLHYKSREELMFAVFEREVHWLQRRYRSLSADMLESERKFRGWAERFIAGFRTERQYVLIIFRALSVDPAKLKVIFDGREQVVRALGRRLPAFRIFHEDGSTDRQRVIALHVLTSRLEDVSLYSAFNEWSEDLDIALSLVTREFLAFARN